jgi:MFS family permease
MSSNQRARRRLSLPVEGESARILAWICLLIAVNQLGFGAIVPVVPLYAEEFGVSAFAVGLTIAIYGFARFLVNVPAGRLAEARGRRITLTLGGVITVVGNLLCALAPSYEVFLGARFIAGAGGAMVLTAGQIVVADIASPQNRGRLMAIYQGVFSFAIGIGPVPGGILADRIGLSAPFFGSAITAGLVTALAWIWVPETRGFRPQEATIEPAPPTTANASPVPALKEPTSGWLTPAFVLIGLVSFSTFFTRTGALFNVVPLIAEAEMALSADQIGVGIGMISLVGLFLSYPSGWMVDRFGRKGVIVPSTVISGFSVLLFSFVGSYSGYLLACAIWSIGAGISSAAPAAYAADIAPAGQVASALGRFRTISGAGYVLGPLSLGFIAEVWQPEAALYCCIVLLVLSGLAFAFFAPETLPSRRRSAETVKNEAGKETAAPSVTRPPAPTSED